jgi:chitodextrinase
MNETARRGGFAPTDEQMNSTNFAAQRPGTRSAAASGRYALSRKCALVVFVAGSALLFGCGSGGDVTGQPGSVAATPPPTTPPTNPPTTPPADTTAPSVPASPSATATGTTSINVGWQASTDNVGVTGYSLERCQGAGCTDFTPIAAPTGTSFTNNGLSAATTYRYRVRARDAAANFSAFSAIATATTTSAPPPSDTTPPSQPANLSATADGPFGINLAWQASTDNVGVSGYGLERCQGAACTNFVAIATPTGTSFGDSGLSASTSYRYRVRATDLSGNLGSYSSIAGATTAAPPTPPPAGTLPGWVNALAPGQWIQIPNTVLGNVEPSPIPAGNSGPASKVIAWTSFVVDTRDSMVYSVANGGHWDYSGNEVNRLALETETPAWTQRLAPTPSGSVIESVTHYADGRPTSRHSYYGVTLNTLNDRVMILGGSKYGNGFGFVALDSYNVAANSYSPPSTHPAAPSSTMQLASAVTADPATGDIYIFGNFESAKWTRSSNSWTAIGGSGTKPWGAESMSAMDTTRGRILVIGGHNSDHHTYTPGSNTFATVTFTGASASSIASAQKGALVYVEAIDRFLVRLGGAGGTVYQIHPSTFEVTTFTSSGSAAIPSTQNGPYNKFLYVPRLRGAVYVPVYDGNAWFLRIH